MHEPQSTTDLRILDEMAEEIEKYGITQLPVALRGHVRTKRGDRVAFVLEMLARKVIDLKCDLERKAIEINGLRDDMHVISNRFLQTNSEEK